MGFSRQEYWSGVNFLDLLLVSGLLQMFNMTAAEKSWEGVEEVGRAGVSSSSHVQLVAKATAGWKGSLSGCWVVCKRGPALHPEQVL